MGTCAFIKENIEDGGIINRTNFHFIHVIGKGGFGKVSFIYY